MLTTKFVTGAVGFRLVLGSLLLLLVGPAQASLISITDLVGEAHIGPSPISLGLSKVWDGETVNGVLYVVGSKDGQAALQSIDLTSGTPVVGTVQLLPSLNANDLSGEIRKIGIVDGQPTFVGLSKDASGVFQGTTWTLSGSVTGTGQIDLPSSSANFDISVGGIIVGQGSNDSAVVGKIGGQIQLLPHSEAFGNALSISENGKWIVGSDGFGPAIYFSENPSELDYSLRGISLQTTSDGFLPDYFVKAIVDPTFGAVGIGHYFDSNIFGEGEAAWSLETGALLRDFGIGSFLDAKLFGDSTVLMFNSPDYGYLTTLGNPNTMLLGSLIPGAVFGLPGGLFEGSVGVLAQDGTGTNFSVASFNVSPTAVPEPSSIALLASSLLMCGLSFMRRRKLGSY
ncbi:MAG: PEP-CTERM sorting domain-containing protein [Bdellovibrionota bacterium]